MSLKEKIIEILEVTKGKFKKFNFKSIMDDIIEATSFLDSYDPKPQERIYHILNDISTSMICPVCNDKLRSFRSINKGYGKYCSVQCTGNSEESKNIRNKSHKEYYSDETNYEKTLLNRQYSFLITMIEKHNYTYNSILEKTPNELHNYLIENTSIKIDSLQELYYVYCESIIEHPKCYCGNDLDFINIHMGYKKYCSTECQNKSQEKYDKMAETNEERHGVDHYSKTIEFKDKTRNTWNNKTDEEKKEIYERAADTYNNKTEEEKKEIVDKRIQTNLKEHGVTNTLLLEKNRKKAAYSIRETNWEKHVDMLIDKKITPLFNRDDYLNFSEEDTKRYKCDVCDNIIETNSIQAKEIFCMNHGGKSIAEHEIKEFLNNNGIHNIEMNKRFSVNGKVREIDIFLPEYNIGIEHHGIYYHSESKLNTRKVGGKIYHYDKYKFFNEIGIRIIQVFSSEWILKRDIVESIIKNSLKLNSNKIYTRKCILKDISHKEFDNFLEINHMQGNVNSKYRYGLFYNDELVSVCGFKKNRYSKDDNFELTRFCNKMNTSVVGSFSKFIKHFTRTVSSNIITFCDLRYFDGHGYEKNGFKFSRISKPNYFYFKDSTLVLESRIKYQKHKLKDTLPIFDESKTEYENMIDNKYRRIFDAGNIKYVFTKNSWHFQKSIVLY